MERAGLRCICLQSSKRRCLQSCILFRCTLAGVNLLHACMARSSGICKQCRVKAGTIHNLCNLCLQCGHAALQAVSKAFARGDLAAANEGKIHLRYVIRILQAIEKKE